ncbi:unnamed protein product [Blepharisma stoltei]|uniref:Uncharacterized protein n=1 Tax=Blepharisma stoltei TaxID=1481888 RepID=A0AAU9ICR6_9CILI|nr:unnamed protein product [Blepharisma stoltei]
MSGPFSALVSDAISALELNPTDSRTVSKVDIQRIADLIGKEINDEAIEDCLQYLYSKKSIGSGFKSKYLINWFAKHYGEISSSQSPVSYQFQDRQSQVHKSVTNRSPKVPQNNTGNPVKDACNNLIQYLESLEDPDSSFIADDQNIKKLITECLTQFERKPKARQALQKAYELVEENYRSEQAKKGEEFSNLSKIRLQTTKNNRVSKLQKDVDFLMKNQPNSNIGSGIYFLLSPDWNAKPKPPTSLLRPAHNKRLKELLQEP